MELSHLIRVPFVDNVRLHRLNSIHDGVLCLTGHHLMFSSKTSQKEEVLVRFF
jgi:hypothetical protein